MKIKQRKRTLVIKNLRSAYISYQKTKSVYFKSRPLPPLVTPLPKTVHTFFYFQGLRGGITQCLPPRTLVPAKIDIVLFRSPTTWTWKAWHGTKIYEQWQGPKKIARVNNLVKCGREWWHNYTKQ